MATRYTPDELMFLRDSPLVSRPASLPPSDQWMGPTADVTHSSRRPAAERHVPRNSANPEDIILGPPKTAFMSAGSMRNASKPSDLPERPSIRDADSNDRYNLRNKGREGDGERTRGERNSNLRLKRIEGDRDQDGEGWSTVKPRKSFGTEGAERFNGRMGGVDRHREDRKYRDREDREVKEKPRGFDTFSRDIEHDQERETRRSGTGRGRNESWFKDKEPADAPSTPRDRNSNGDRFIDRNRGWREKENGDSRGGDRVERNEKGNKGDRGERRWGDQPQENTPEWSLDVPVEEKPKTNQTKTAEDFQKWKEQMQGKDKVAVTTVEETKPDEPPSLISEKSRVETPLEMNNGPDKFFGSWIGGKEGTTPEEPKMEATPKAKTMGKASRFTSFFTPQEEPQRRVTEPAAPPSSAPMQSGLAAFFGGGLGGGQPSSSDNNSQSAAAEKEAFQSLLQKLQHQTLSSSGSTPPLDASRQPKPPPPEKQRSNPVPGPEIYQQYRAERPEEARPSARNPQQSIPQEILNQRQITGSQPIIRPEQMLQDLVGQRHSATSQPSRPDLPPSRNNNADFLMGLMQSARAAPDPRPTEQTLLRMAPRTVDRMMQQQVIEREQELQREAAQRERASQRQVRPPPPPGFMSFDEATVYRGLPHHERQPGNPPQPTQILQRPPPPGLDMGWDRQPQLPPQHRIAQNIAPPPGLANGPSNGPNRGMPLPQNMYPPGFPMGAFPPPDVMAGPPRNMQMQPPPGFFNQPPPGFMPPGMSGFQGPEGMSFGSPFDGRGPPHQGAFRRQ
ncbi:hypothetical protein LZ554_003408 [Drepanopeziza brunnea f. sp. 'monogermtubi']|nr:hypothetical protein LZ554_003408 [Drepanopeziza brunnea f. sp. 'monogermtubi']